METAFASINAELLNFANSFGSSHRTAARNFHLVEDGMSRDYVHHLVRLGRFFKKFEEPEQSNADKLHAETIARWVATDEELRPFDEAYFIRKGFADIRLIRMKRLIHQWCSLFELRNEDAWVGPGETYYSSGGDVSAYGKFLCTERWSVTRDCYPFFKDVIEQNRPLKRWVLDKGRDLAGIEGKVKQSYTFDQCFNSVCSIVLGARVTSVPKNNEKRRPINIEPLGNSMLQYAVGRALMRCLSAIGNDLYTGQADHRRMLEDPEKATLDLSDASDRVSIGLVRFLFPSKVERLLEAVRSKCTEVDGVYIRTHKISCQGNGFTFPLMTMILLAACIACGDESARVYGDDIIVNNDVASDVAEFIESLGFKVNHEKSFISRQFRESCGGFYYSGYIRCFDIEWVDNYASMCSTLNKVALYAAEGHQDQDLWLSLHDRLLTHVPEEHVGPMPERDRDRLDVYVWSMRPRNRSTLKASACHWLGERFDRRTGEISFVYAYEPVKHLVDNGDGPLDRRYDRLVGSSLRIKAGAPVTRHRRTQVQWARIGVFVDSGGALMLEKEYRRLRNAEKAYLTRIFGSVPGRSEWEAWNLQSFKIEDYYASLDEWSGKSYLR